MAGNADWLEKLITNLEKRKAANEETLNICKEALKKSLEPYNYWLQEKEKVEKDLKKLEESLKLWKQFLRKYSR